MSGPARISVIFVDDERQVLDGIRRKLRQARESWTMRFAASGDEALAQMEADPADAVVSDMRMPGMNGVTLLREVRRRWPGAARLMLSGQTDQTELMADIGAVHQFLHKPCPLEVILQSVSRAMSLARSVETRPLRQLVAGLESLPVVSRTLQDLTRVLAQRSSDLDAVAEVVERDVGVSAKLLQMVNSAFFAMPRPIGTVREAVLLVGLSNLRALVVTAQVFRAMATDDERDGVLGQLWAASLEAGALAARMARAHHQPDEVCEAARLAGLLSLVGRSVLVYGAADAFASARAQAGRSGAPLWEAERAKAGVAQHTLGGYALGLWAFRPEIVEAVCAQAEPETVPGVGLDHPLCYAHAARCRVLVPGLVERVRPHEDWLGSIGFNVSLVSARGEDGWATRLAS